MGYQVMHRTIKPGPFVRADEKIERGIQPLLDEGVRKGWELHSFETAQATEGINVILIWRTP